MNQKRREDIVEDKRESRRIKAEGKRQLSGCVIHSFLVVFIEEAVPKETVVKEGVTVIKVITNPPPLLTHPLIFY